MKNTRDISVKNWPFVRLKPKYRKIKKTLFSRFITLIKVNNFLIQNFTRNLNLQSRFEY